MLSHGKNVLKNVQRRVVVSPGHISQMSTARQVGVAIVILKAFPGGMEGKLLQMFYLEKRLAQRVSSFDNIQTIFG